MGAGQVIKCWDEGFVGLAKGAKADLICPPDYAYGKRAMGPIPANSPLKLSIEVVEIEPAKKPEANKDTGTQQKEEPKTEEKPVKFSMTVTSQGDGPVVEKGDKIKAHYRGTLLDGTQFDSSYDRN